MEGAATQENWRHYVQIYKEREETTATNRRVEAVGN